MIDTAGSLAELRAIFTQTEGMEKRPNDLLRYETILERVKPSVLLETGLHFGGSLRWFAERVPQVVSVEHDLDAVFAVEEAGYPDNATIIAGDSLGVVGDVIDHVEKLAAKGPVMVVLDSDHGTEHVYGEMLRYGELVTKGSYLVVEDGIFHYLPDGPRLIGNWYDGDPLIAIERYLRAFPGRFEVDHELEDAYPTTQHPCGWLRRR